MAEFDNVETIDQLAGALEALGCEVVRVGRGQALAARLVAGDRYDLVFSIAEGVKGRSREAQVPALCELFDQPYLFSDPLTMTASLDKAVAKRLVRDAGVKTPSFAVAERSATRSPAWSRIPGIRQAARRRHRQRLRGGLSGRDQGRIGGRRPTRDRALPPAGAGRALSARPRVHRRHRRQRPRGARARRVRDPAQAECRGQCLLAPQQGAVRGPGHLRPCR